MGIPENIQPVIEKMSEFTAAVQKLTAGLADGIDAKVCTCRPLRQHATAIIYHSVCSFSFPLQSG
jgi:hypothetical protein